MATKTVELPDIGPVTLTKRRGNNNIRLSFTRDGQPRVSLPYWLPYQAGVEFILSRRDWVDKHRPKHRPSLQHDDHIGKAHRLRFARRAGSTEPRVRVKNNVVTVSCPVDMPSTHASVQKAAERGALRALQQEANQLLPVRLKTLAGKYSFDYSSVRTKRLASRWGSCSQHRDIVLNIYLMQLPWHLIDYVLLHELVHTEHLDHSSAFWRRFEQAEPSAKRLRRELKTHQTIITPTSSFSSSVMH